MKKIFLNLIALLMIFVLFSCEKELHKYEGKPTIYFNDTGRLPAFSGDAIKDSTIMSFSLASAQDSIVNMVVTTIGQMQNTDRPYKLVINAASDAIAGTHYDILNPTFLIKKNQLSDTIKIKFYRKADMQTKSFLLSFDLAENENFSTDMKYKIANATTGRKHSYINYRWYVNDIIKKPARWLDTYLGTFSRKKLFLMVDVLHVNPSYMDTSISIAETLAYGKFMQRYLNEQRAAGNIILEDDGTEMIMGASVQ